MTTVPSYVAAFRAYEWTKDIALLAQRFFSACPGARQVVLLNEAKGPIDVGGYEKVSHGDDFSALGLPERPVGKSLWFNADYSFVFLRQALPEYDHYIISESDVAVNLSLDGMVRHAAEHGIDAILHRLRPVDPEWHWYPEALAQDNPCTAFVFICLFSGRALDAVLEERLALARAVEAGLVGRWPLVASLVATALRARGLRFAEIGQFAKGDDLVYRPVMSLSNPRAHRPGTLVHPVLGRPNFTRSLLSVHPPRDYFREGSVLQAALRSEPLADVAPTLADAFALAGDHAGLAMLHAEMRSQGIAVPRGPDLAFCKPAISSSVSQWSRQQDMRLDANGANGLATHGDYGFHTAPEADAWWIVDLVQVCAIDRVCIVNREGFTERFQWFTIDSSEDGIAWTMRFSKRDDAVVSSDLEQPWSVLFDPPFVARHVRIRRLGPPGPLHLRRVRIFGSELDDPAASSRPHADARKDAAPLFRIAGGA